VPRERLLVLRSEDLYADPATVYAQVLGFLGLDAFNPAEFAVHTRRVDRAEPPAEAVRALREHFAPHNARLADLLAWPDPWPGGRSAT
jgi:hypothetical protein